MPACAKVFGFLSDQKTCDRPYGHTGSHTAEGTVMRGGRDQEDEERTRFVLTLASRGSGP